MGRTQHAIILLLASVLFVWPARAQSTVLSEQQSRGYYATHLVLGVALLGANILTPLLLHTTPSSSSSEGFPGDLSVREQISAEATNASDVLLMGTLITPLAGELGRGFDIALLNYSIPYREAVGVELLLSTLVRYGVQRPRPYSYNPNPLVRRFAQQQGDAAYLSFYSAHTGAAFSAAVAGSYLFGAENRGTGASKAMWSCEFAMAAATAILRVRAGREYYSDIIVGAVAGMGIGIAVPLLDGIRYKPSASEVAFGFGGLVVGVAGGALVPIRRNSVVIDTSVASVAFAPVLTRAGGGINLFGMF